MVDVNANTNANTNIYIGLQTPPVDPKTLTKVINDVATALDGTSVASPDLVNEIKSLGGSVSKIRGQIQRLLDDADPSNPNIPIIKELLDESDAAYAGNPFLRVSAAMVQMIVAYSEMAQVTNYTQALQGDFVLQFMQLTLKAGLDAANLQLTLGQQEQQSLYLDAAAEFGAAVTAFASAAISAGCLSKSNTECQAIQDKPDTPAPGDVRVGDEPPGTTMTPEQKSAEMTRISQKWMAKSQAQVQMMTALQNIIKGTTDILKGDVAYEKGKTQSQVQTLQALQQLFSKELDMLTQAFQSNSDQFQKAMEALTQAFSQYHQMMQAQGRG